MAQSLVDFAPHDLKKPSIAIFGASTRGPSFSTLISSLYSSISSTIIVNLRDE